MITELENLVEEVNEMKFPSSLKEFDNNESLELIISGLAALLVEIYPKEHPLYLDKKTIRSFFTPNVNPYAKDVHLSKASAWNNGKSRLIKEINTRINDLKNKLKFNSDECFIGQSIINNLAEQDRSDLSVIKLVQFLNEINSTYKQENFLSCILLIRAVLNYVPPIFEQTTFIQVVSQSGKSLKEVFLHLEEGLRKLADLHTHKTFTKKDYIPTRNTIQPYKPQFETLIQEITTRIGNM